MEKISNILSRPLKPFDINDYGGLSDDEYLKDEIIYCRKCNTSRMFIHPDGRKSRSLCDCQAAERNKSEQYNKELEELKEALEPLRDFSILEDERYKDVRFSNTETDHNADFKNAFNRCKRYCENSNKVLEGGFGIYMHGTAGTGKSRLTACMAHELLSQRKQVLFTSFGKIKSILCSTFGKKGNGELFYINKLSDIDFLIIDDLGVERVQSRGDDLWLQEKIFEIINNRYTKKRSTVYTSNYRLNELISDRGFSERTVDRIADKETAIIEIQGESYRLKSRGTVELPF